jgi:hypothetical protein
VQVTVARMFGARTGPEQGLHPRPALCQRLPARPTEYPLEARIIPRVRLSIQ